MSFSKSSSSISPFLFIYCLLFFEIKCPFSAPSIKWNFISYSIELFDDEEIVNQSTFCNLDLGQFMRWMLERRGVVAVKLEGSGSENLLRPDALEMHFAQFLLWYQNDLVVELNWMGQSK